MTSLPPSVDELRLVGAHDHLSLLYEDREELLGSLVPFFQHGLARNERCVYIGDSPPVGKELDALIQAGLLVVATKDSYLRGGRFDLERMLDLFRESVDHAHRDGHAGLRVAGEASWPRAEVPGIERFFEYESRVNELFSELNVLALCLYERRLFSPEQLHSVLLTHPLVIHRGALCRNNHYEPPAEFLSPRRSDREIDRRLDLIHQTPLRAANALLPEKAFQSQRLAAIGRLAGGIAHEFNNILTGVIGLAQFVEQELPPFSPSRDDVRQIKTLGERAAAMTNQLLAFAQRRNFQPLKLELQAVVASTAGLLRQTLGENVEFSLSEPGPPLFVHIDPQALEQILLQLAVNAREAMPDGGKLEIGTRAVTLSRAGEATKDYALLSVTDTGIGMPPETQALIFDPFFSTKNTGPSSGLGLTAVHGLVGQSDGFIEVLSAPGRGTTFLIHFPLVSPEPGLGQAV